MKHTKYRHLVVVMLILALVLSTVALVAACGGRDEGTDAGDDTASPAASESAAAGIDVTKVAVIVPEKANDYGWNQMGVESAQKAAAAMGAECIVQDGAGYGDITPIMNQLAEQEPQLIFAWASGYQTVAANMAQQLQIAVTSADPGTEEANVPMLVNAVEENAQDGAYLAGILAANMSKTGTIAIVASADDLNWAKMGGGYIAGARSVKPDIKVLYVQIGQAGYADAAGGKRVTQNAISGGADIIFGFGDGSSFGMMQACETATPPAGADKVYFIDVIGDKSSLDEKGIYLSSVVWDFEQVDTQLIEDLENGTFGEKSIYLDLDNGLYLLQTDLIPEDVWAQCEEAKAGIMDGSIEVPLTTSAKDVKAMIAAGE
jgi:simple sugar transport system substrate-binding protein